jgi:hypothetical protein
MFWATAFAPTPYFGTFLPNVVAIKSIKNYLRKIYEIAPWSYLQGITRSLSTEGAISGSR